MQEVDPLVFGAELRSRRRSSPVDRPCVWVRVWLIILSAPFRILVLYQILYKMSIVEVKNRIKAVKNIGQITKAMEVVAATKMRKSQQVALDSRPYAFKALNLLAILGKQATVRTALMRKRTVKRTLLIIVTSDRGLAGSFNSQVFRMADSFLKSY